MRVCGERRAEGRRVAAGADARGGAAVMDGPIRRRGGAALIVHCAPSRTHTRAPPLTPPRRLDSHVKAHSLPRCLPRSGGKSMENRERPSNKHELFTSRSIATNCCKHRGKKSLEHSRSPWAINGHVTNFRAVTRSHRAREASARTVTLYTDAGYIQK